MAEGPHRLETPRLVLREFEETDWPAVLAFSGPEAMRFFDEEPHNEEAAKEWVAEAIRQRNESPRRRVILAVERREERDVVGYCDLVLRLPLECRMAYSGFRYVPSCWGRGYGTEAERALLAFGFRALGLERVSCICEPENTGSWKLMEKCGMRREGHGILGDWSVKRGRRVSTYSYAVLREEWKAANP
jgi:RimJ/RimL family protein N-acetyltransferase